MECFQTLLLSSLYCVHSTLAHSFLVHLWIWHIKWINCGTSWFRIVVVYTLYYLTNLIRVWTKNILILRMRDNSFETSSCLLEPLIFHLLYGYSEGTISILLHARSIRHASLSVVKRNIFEQNGRLSGRTWQSFHFICLETYDDLNPPTQLWCYDQMLFYWEIKHLTYALRIMSLICSTLFTFLIVCSHDFYTCMK